MMQHFILTSFLLPKIISIAICRTKSRVLIFRDIAEGLTEWSCSLNQLKAVAMAGYMLRKFGR